MFFAFFGIFPLFFATAATQWARAGCSSLCGLGRACVYISMKTKETEYAKNPGRVWPLKTVLWKYQKQPRTLHRKLNLLLPLVPSTRPLQTQQAAAVPSVDTPATTMPVHPVAVPVRPLHPIPQRAIHRAMSTIEPGLFVNNSNLKSDEYMHLCAEINKLKRDLAYMKKTIYTTYAAAGNTQAPTPTPTPATSATTTTTSPTPKVHLSKHAVSFAHGEAPDTPLGKPRAEVTIFSAPHTVGEFPNLTPQVRAQAAQ